MIKGVVYTQKRSEPVPEQAFGIQCRFGLAGGTFLIPFRLASMCSPPALARHDRSQKTEQSIKQARVLRVLTPIVELAGVPNGTLELARERNRGDQPQQLIPSPERVCVAASAAEGAAVMLGGARFSKLSLNGADSST